jgi:hypothetical protein
MNLDEKLEELVDLLVDNYLLSSVIIVATEKVKNEDGEHCTSIEMSRRGNSYEQIGMMEECKNYLINL